MMELNKNNYVIGKFKIISQKDIK